MKQSQKEKTAIQTALFSIIGNTILAIIKATAGVFGNSYALIADAIESTSDILASGILYFGIKLASRPPDDNHPYGHGKIEPLITFIMVAFLLISATLIGYQSIININTPQTPPKPWTLGVLAGVILWKEISFQIIIRRSHTTKSMPLKAEAWHHRSDAITSVVAFVGITIAVFFGPGYETADDWAALVAAIFIVYHSYYIFLPALGEIMDKHNVDILEAVRKHSNQVEGIIGTEKCLIRKSGLHYHLELHAVVDGSITVKEGHRLAHCLEEHLRDTIPDLGSVIVHIEPDENFRQVF